LKSQKVLFIPVTVGLLKLVTVGLDAVAPSRHSIISNMTTVRYYGMKHRVPGPTASLSRHSSATQTFLYSHEYTQVHRTQFGCRQARAHTHIHK